MRQLTDVWWRQSSQHVTAYQATIMYHGYSPRPRQMRRARPGGVRGDQPVFVHAPSGAAPFAACLRLFRSYPLAVTHPGEPAGRPRTLVLWHRRESPGYYLLSEHPAERFTLRPWGAGDGDAQQIRPGRPVPLSCHRVITEGMPVPRDGAVLAWVSDRQATVLLTVHHGGPSRPPGVPQVRALALVGSDPVRWPPFITSPLDDGRLWQYVARSEIVDLAPVIARGAGDIFWVPSQHPARAAQGHGCVVARRNLTTGDYWLPAGIYMDHWMLREGVPAPSASQLLTLPGVAALARPAPVSLPAPRRCASGGT
jgi:hypothetical protein